MKTPHQKAEDEIDQGAQRMCRGVVSALTTAIELPDPLPAPV
jgi:hypothetical protein